VGFTHGHADVQLVVAHLTPKPFGYGLHRELGARVEVEITGQLSDSMSSETEFLDGKCSESHLAYIDLKAKLIITN
jgi:hypothetical protein